MSATSLVEIRRFLRYLLVRSKLTVAPWLRYAEAEVYAEPVRWWPIWSRIPEDKGAAWLASETQIADYKIFLKATTNPSKPVLSIAKALHDQFDGREASALSPILIAFQHDFSSSKTAATAGRERNPWFQFRPTDADSAEWNAYRTLVCPPGNQFLTGLYDENCLLVGLPLYEAEAGAPYLLTSMILILDGPCENQTLPAHIDEIASLLSEFQHEASQELSHRFVRQIDGRYRDSDPLVLLTHPAWSRTEKRSELRLEGESHGSFDRLDLAAIGHLDNVTSTHSVSPLAPIALSVLSRTTRPLVGKCQSTSAHSDACCLAESSSGGQEVSTNLFGANGEIASKRTRAVHRWIKALYAHRESRADSFERPSASYELESDYIVWVAALLSAAAAPEQPITWNCKSWTTDRSPTKWLGRCLVYAPVDVGFRFPTIPGARFLAPLLSLLDLWNKDKDLGSRPTKESCAVALIVKPPRDPALESALKQTAPHPRRQGIDASGGDANPGVAPGDNPIGPPFSKWLASMTFPDSEKWFGVAMARPGVLGEHRKKAAGIRRALFSGARRRGDTTGALSAVLTCDVRAAMTRGRVPVDPNDPLFAPLTAGGQISFDLEAIPEGPEEPGGRSWLVASYSWEGSQ